jgi:hypothetical protein
MAEELTKRVLLLSGAEKEVTREMVHHAIGKHVIQATKMGYNYQITLNVDTDVKAFLAENNYKSIIHNPVTYELYLPRHEMANVRKFFIKNLNEPTPIREPDLEKAFGDLANIHKIKLSYKKGQCLGYGQISFYDPEGKLAGEGELARIVQGRQVVLEKYEKERGNNNIVTFEVEGLAPAAQD